MAYIQYKTGISNMKPVHMSIKRSSNNFLGHCITQNESESMRSKINWKRAQIAIFLGERVAEEIKLGPQCISPSSYDSGVGKIFFGFSNSESFFFKMLKNHAMV